jgi:endonuclease/exonuclease/phosphatase family metal-dependent hydrolase
MAAPAAQTIRVMTFNIHSKGIKATNGALGKIAELINESRADIVGLQEVDQCCRRSDGIHVPAKLAELTKMEVYFGRTIGIEGGSYGNAILSRFPIKSTTNIPFQEIRDSQSCNSSAETSTASERRCAIKAVIDVDGRELLFINTHLDHKKEDLRLSSIPKLRQMCCGIPTVIVGDFNAEPDSKTIGLVKQFMHDAFSQAGQEENPVTMSSKGKGKCIDYIFISDSITTTAVRTIATDASDHCAVYAELQVFFDGK